MMQKLVGRNRLAATILAAAAMLPVAGRAQSAPFGGVSTGKAVDSDPFLGDWQGQWLDAKKRIFQQDPELVAQVIPRGGGRYQINILPEFDHRCCPYAVIEGKSEGGALAFDDGVWSGKAIQDKLQGEGELKGARGRFELRKVERLSPTLGAKPPQGAVVLFDGTSFDQWTTTGTPDQDICWEIVGDAMRINTKQGAPKQGLRTKRGFGDLQLHIEFRLPLEPENTGQGRANSGVFLGPYEIQVLDSYGLPGYYNECGALYKLAAPRVNRCAPPLQWQTFDVGYRAPRFDSEGRLKSNARITVAQNGAHIHRNVELVHHTSNAQATRNKPVPNEPTRISLQNHGHAVEYRNIWVVEIPRDR